MPSQRDVKNRIDSVKNIRKITRAMEMVAAARLRRAEQRIAHLRPYAGAIRRMTRQAAEAAGGEVGKLPILKQHESEQTDPEGSESGPGKDREETNDQRDARTDRGVGCRRRRRV
jgi:maleate cis-trans isomerase